MNEVSAYKTEKFDVRQLIFLYVLNMGNLKKKQVLNYALLNVNPCNRQEKQTMQLFYDSNILGGDKLMAPTEKQETTGDRKK